jgi:predicted DNA-binding transcriptional regulator YafY
MFTILLKLPHMWQDLLVYWMMKGEAMSEKFDSLMSILNKIDRGERVTIRSLMEDLEISSRSAHRYMTTLLVAGFPVRYDRRRGSYAFDEGYSLRKAHLSAEESLTLALARGYLKNLGPTIEKSFARIEKEVFNHVQDVRGHMVLAPDPLPVDVGERLTVIHHAAVDFQRIEIAYRALSSNEVTVRQVDPYYLFFVDGFWEMRGYCHLRKELRTFAMDRVESLKVLPRHFVRQKATWEEDLSGAFEAYIDGDPTEVVLRFDKAVRPRIERKKWHPSQVSTPLPDGSLEMTLRVNGIEGVRHWIYRWLPHVEVVSPLSIREVVTNELMAALALHGER